MTALTSVIGGANRVHSPHHRTDRPTEEERSQPRRVDAMQIELNRDEVELLRDMLQHQVKELDKEINRTDSLAFKRGLQEDDRALERILGRLAAALERVPD
jgi:hypothetical protein